MYERPLKPTSRSLPAQRATGDPASAAPALGPAALPRLDFASLAVHPPRSATQSPARPLPNRTGLPDRLKSGVERLSGVSLDGVKVHYNSPRPARIEALAYAQGRDIHLAPGQEHHLPHEAWHLVQQAQGRVKPTMQLKDGVRVNDHVGLEREADVMGARAANGGCASPRLPTTAAAGHDPGRLAAAEPLNPPPPLQAMLKRVLTPVAAAAVRSVAPRRLVATTPSPSTRPQTSLDRARDPTREPERRKMEAEAARRAEQNQALYRADRMPFDRTNPFGPTPTPKAHFEAGQMHPADPQGKTTPALHVHGKAEDKALSPYISTSRNAEKVSPHYGDDILEMRPPAHQVVTPTAIQEDLRTSPDPRLDEPAYNVTQPGKPAWAPETDEHKEAARKLGIPAKPSYTYRERALVNNERDQEYLTHGSVALHQMHRLVRAARIAPHVNWGSDPGQVNVYKIGLEQGRDPHTVHPQGYRVPLDVEQVENSKIMGRLRAKDAEVHDERKKDNEYALQHGLITEAQFQLMERPLPYTPRNWGATPGQGAKKDKEQLSAALGHDQPQKAVHPGSEQDRQAKKRDQLRAKLDARRKT